MPFSCDHPINDWNEIRMRMALLIFQLCFYFSVVVTTRLTIDDSFIVVPSILYCVCLISFVVLRPTAHRLKSHSVWMSACDFVYLKIILCVTFNQNNVNWNWTMFEWTILKDRNRLSNEWGEDEGNKPPLILLLCVLLIKCISFFYFYTVTFLYGMATEHSDYRHKQIPAYRHKHHAIE
jgi:hypothetical protein